MRAPSPRFCLRRQHSAQTAAAVALPRAGAATAARRTNGVGPPPPLARLAVFALAGLALRHLRTPRTEALPPAADCAAEEAAEEAEECGDSDTCRFCFAAGTSRSPLLSPCACRGTQAFVHAHCLEAWQRSSLVTRGALEAECRVCGAPFAAPRPGLRTRLRQWFAPRAADRVRVWTGVWAQILANTLLPLDEPRLASVADVALIAICAEGRVLTGREIERGRPLLRALRSAAIVFDGAHAVALLAWAAAGGAAGAADALRSLSRRGDPRPHAPLAAAGAVVLGGVSAGLLLPVRALLCFEPLYRAVALCERWPQYRL